MIPEVKSIAEGIELYVFDIEKFTDDIVRLIDRNLVQICEGDTDTSLGQAKLTFIDFLENKDDTTKIGAIAEFFVHLFLRESGYNQEFLFYNLEERSIKKGFDGYFSRENQQYIVESKSGFETTKNISHQAKVKEAYKDLSSTVAGKSKKSSKGKNNPWKNAYNHASHIDVGSSKSIRKNLKKLSDLFDQGTFQNVENLNVIPCSTIFLNNNWHTGFSNSILLENVSFFNELKAEQVKVVCITQASYRNFISYLKGIAQ